MSSSSYFMPVAFSTIWLNEFRFGLVSLPGSGTVRKFRLWSRHLNLCLQARFGFFVRRKSNVPLTPAFNFKRQPLVIISPGS